MNQQRKNNYRKRLKIHILLLLMFIMVYNHNVWAIERFNSSFKNNNNGGIYPRGGAMERGFTDVIQIAPLQTRSESLLSSRSYNPTSSTTTTTTSTISRREERIRKARYGSSSSNNNSMGNNVLTSKRGMISNKLQSLGNNRNGNNKNNTNNNNKDTHGQNTIRTDVEDRLPYVFMRNPPTSTLNKSSLQSTTTTTTTTATTTLDPTQISPSSSSNHGQRLIYRYFGRSRTRTGSDSIPFIILGPSVDHWKICGKILASRGFNVMACERVPTEESITSPTTTNNFSKEPILYMDEDGRPIHEGEALITSILNALKWQKAVLVGCDEESVLLIEAAIRMAPERVAGLVLCGDLQSVERHVEKLIENLERQASHLDEDTTNMSVDSFLEDFLDCPTSIIWGGDRGDDCITREAEVDTLRSVIIGGGVAPHRRLPEQFAWTLSRFVENKVSPHSAAYDLGQTMEGQDGEYSTSLGDDVEQAPPSESRLRRAINYTRYHSVWKEILPESITKALDDIFAPGSLLVTGRVIAFAIMYMSIARVSLFQYQNIRDLPTTIFSAKNIMNLLVSVPGLLFRRKRQMIDDGRPVTDSGGNVLFQDEIDENEKLKDPLVAESVPELDTEEESKSHSQPPMNNPLDTDKVDDYDPLIMRDDSILEDGDHMEKEDQDDKFHHRNDDDHDDIQDQDLKHFFFDQIVS
jgi:hypothetical protein